MVLENATVDGVRGRGIDDSWNDTPGDTEVILGPITRLPELRMKS